MENRIDKDNLLNTLSIWDSYLKRKVHLIACGGTALTLMNLKSSTKDIDLIVPKSNEYRYLVKTLEELGYERITGTGWARDDGFRFDLYVCKNIFTTELLESPLDEGNNFLFKEFSHIYLGVLNYYDLIISKLFRYTPVDTDDCLCLIMEKSKEIKIDKLKKRFYETSSYDISDDKNKRNFSHFLKLLEEKGLKK